MKKSFYLLRLTFIATFLVAMNVLVLGQYFVTVENPSYPNIQWEKGTVHWISWVDNFDLGANVWLMDESGTATITNIVTNTLESTIPWTVTGTVGTKYKIRVESSVKPDKYKDVSDNAFTVVASLGDRLVLINPNWPGLKWERGSTQKISWTDNLNGTIKVELLKDGAYVETIDPTVSPSLTYISWPISATMTPSKEYQIRLTSNEFTDVTVTGEKFEIPETMYEKISIIQPNWPGIVWNQGEHAISWVDNLEGVNGNVSIYLLDGLGGTYTITTGLPHPTSWIKWNFKDVAPGTYMIKIVSDAYPNVVSATGVPFEITDNLNGKITLIQPNWTGIKWDRGKTHKISWVDNLSGSVRIDLLKGTSVATSTSVVAEVGDALTTYDWPIDEDLEAGTDYRIKITSNDFPGVVSVTGDYFEIVDVLDGVIVLQQPDVAGIQWLADNNTEYWISWVDNLPYPIEITLLHSPTIGGPFTATSTIFTTTSTIETTYKWKIPTTLYDDDGYFKIHLSCVGCTATTTDESEHPFQILSSLGGEISLIQPTWAGIEWMAGSTQWISWMDNLQEDLYIDLLKDEGTGYEKIFEIAGPNSIYSKPSIPANQSVYQWTIPQWGNHTITTDDYVYKIKITSSGNASITTESDNPFRIYQPVDNITLYPNPANEFTTVQIDNISGSDYVLTLYDRFGSIVRKINVDNSDSIQATIQTYDLPNGIYFLNATSNEKNISKKIIVQH